ncbi:MAG: hypothetical protein AAF438_10580 [Pseudomonadota bacterium]
MLNRFLLVAILIGLSASFGYAQSSPVIGSWSCSHVSRSQYPNQRPVNESWQFTLTLSSNGVAEATGNHTASNGTFRFFAKGSWGVNEGVVEVRGDMEGGAHQAAARAVGMPPYAQMRFFGLLLNPQTADYLFWDKQEGNASTGDTRNASECRRIN